MSSGALCIQELWERSSRSPIRLQREVGIVPVRRDQPRRSRRAISAGRGGRGRRGDGPCARRTPVAMCSSTHDAVRLPAQLGELSPPRRRPNQSPSGPVRRSRSTGACGVTCIPSRPSRRSAMRRAGRMPSASAKASMTSHSSRASPRGRDHRVRPLHERRRVEAEEGERHVLALEERRRREHVVGVPVRLVDVEVERDEQVELGERALQRLAVGHRQHRVAGRHEQRPHLAGAGVSISRGISDAGMLPSTSGKPPMRERVCAVGVEAGLLGPRRRARSRAGRRPRRRARRGCR